MNQIPNNQTPGSQLPATNPDLQNNDSSNQSINQAGPMKIQKKSGNKIILFLVLLSLIIFVSGVVIYFLTSKRTKKPDSPSGQVGSGEKIKIDKFENEQEFQSYLEESVEEYGYFNSMEARIVTEDTMEAPSGLGGDEAVYKQTYRVSDTNVQVKGIDEPDIVKTDGKNIYFSSQYQRFLQTRSVAPIEPILEDDRTVNNFETEIISAFPPDNLSPLSSIKETGDLILSQNNLVVFNGNNIVSYDVSAPQNPQKSWDMILENNVQVVSSRLFGNKLFLITSTRTGRYTPCVTELSKSPEIITISCIDIYRPELKFPIDSTYTIFEIDPQNGEVKNKASFVGNSSQGIVYMSTNYIYITYPVYQNLTNIMFDFVIDEANDLFPESLVEKLKKIRAYDISQEAKMTELMREIENYQNSLSPDDKLKIENETENKMQEYTKKRVRDFIQSGLIRININNLKIDSSQLIPGYPLNQFSLDEYESNLRLATTVGQSSFGSSIGNENDLYIFNSNLEMISSVEGMGVDERIYSVRFIEDKGYIVTFRQTDPFYVLDLSNPRDPQLKGELKIPGYSSYLHPINKERIIGIGKEGSNVKISFFNVSNPENPIESSKYSLDEYWSEILNTHHAFLMDSENKIFFLPGSRGGYIFSYANDTLSLTRAVELTSVRRALYINNYLYIISDSEIVVLDEENWTEVNRLLL